MPNNRVSQPRLIIASDHPAYGRSPITYFTSAGLRIPLGKDDSRKNVAR